jgi:hypothetical protein
VFGFLGLGATLELILLVWCYFTKTKVEDTDLFTGGCTTVEGLKEVIYSLNACEAGYWPTVDRNGEPFQQEPFKSNAGELLCGWVFGMLWNFRADAGYKVNYLQMPGHWRSHFPCVGCPANSVSGDPMHFLNFGDSNTWMDNIFMDMDVYRAYCIAQCKPICLLFVKREEGVLGAHVLIMLHDTLHAIDLGPAMHVCGSTLWLLCYGKYVLDDKPAEAMDIVFERIQAAYVTHKTPTRFTNLHLEMFTNVAAPSSQYAELSGKGAEMRHLVPILAEVWLQFARPGNGHDAHVSAVLDSLTQIFAILDWKTDDGLTPLFLNDICVTELRTCIDAFLTHMSFLKTLYMEEDMLLWHMTSKSHSIYHVGFEAQFQHPSSARCYINEDFVRLLQQCGLSNRHAIPADRRALTVVNKYPMGKSLDLLLGRD